MKKQILIVLLLSAAGISSYAQCDKKIVFTSGKTEFLNSNNELQKTKEELTTVEYDSKEIIITPGDNIMEGTVNSVSCDWKTPFKEGKTVIKATLTSANGKTMNMTITIEGIDGKLTLLGEFDEMADRKIRLTPDKFEEKK